MSNNVKVELNHAGIRSLLRSEEAKAMCRSYADAAVQRLGAGDAADDHVGRGRVNASVYADTPEAERENLDTNALIKALHG